MRLRDRTQVLVVGAGPVGLFGALSAAERGLSVTIVDQAWRGAMHSYALALHPQSLRLLDRYGAADALIRQGRRIQTIAFYEGDQRAAEIDVSAVGGPFPYVLVAPQNALESALAERLLRSKIPVRWNHVARSVTPRDDEVVVHVAAMEKHSMGYPIARTEWLVARETDVHAAFVIGADGYHSVARDAAGARFERHGDPEVFAVYEFSGRLSFPGEVRVAYHEGTTNVVWPIADERARFSFQVDPDTPPAPDVESLRARVRARAPWFQDEIGEVIWTSTALFERRLVDRFGRGRIWLAGDAAHVTGPVGAQSMNVGLREVHDLTERISALLKSASSTDELEAYDRECQSEWRSLLGVAGPPRSVRPGWSADRGRQILPCLPASGEDLAGLLAQIGLQLA